MGHPGPRAGSPEGGWPGWPWDPSPKPALKREERMPTGGRHHRAGAALRPSGCGAPLATRGSLVQMPRGHPRGS